VLTGEGGYEGLTLIMGQSANDDTMTNWSIILPSDLMPPVPEPIEPNIKQASLSDRWQPEARTSRATP
jgi:hypothetical protein